jgi:hypothetical protein
MKTLLETLNYQPCRLSPQEIQNPEQAIMEFFANHSLHESREQILELYNSWLEVQCEDLYAPEILKKMMFLDGLTNLIGLCYVVSHNFEFRETLAEADIKVNLQELISLKS